MNELPPTPNDTTGALVIGTDLPFLMFLRAEGSKVSELMARRHLSFRSRSIRREVPRRRMEQNRVLVRDERA